MQARYDSLEISLYQAIREGDTKTAVTLIDLIQTKTKGPSLVTRNEEGKSFLCLALIARNFKIIHKLFEILKNDVPIILGSDNDQCSLLWHAIDRGCVDFAKNVIAVALRHKNKLWLKGDKNGITPLHVAARKNNLEAVELLLEYICNESNVVEILNQADANGNTALHLCAGSINYASILTLLVKRGADLFVCNNKNESPIDHFLKLDPITQQNTFKKFPSQVREIILAHVKGQILENIELRNLYFRLASINSLQSLLIAHFEYNAKIPLYSSGISSDILSTIPLYSQRLEEAVHPAARSVSVATISKDNTNQHLYQTLNEDRAHLTELLTAIEQYIAELQLKPSISYCNRSLAFILPVVFLGVIAAIMFGLWKLGEATASVHDHGWHQDTQWSAGYILFFILACTIAFCGTIASLVGPPSSLWNKENDVDVGERWKILKSLNQQISANLHMLKEAEDRSAKGEQYMPTSVETMHDLDEVMNHLYRQHSLSQTFGLFIRLQQLVRTLQADMNKSHRPLSLFAPKSRVIDIKEITQERRLQLEV